MGKTVYLLGAGASANAIPTYTNMPERIQAFYQFLSNCSQGGELISTLKTELIEYIAQVTESGTPDNFAIRLGRSESSGDRIKYEHFKRFISLYFAFEQLGFANSPNTRVDPFLHRYIDQSIWKQIGRNLDTRYYTLFGTILSAHNDKALINSDVSFVTWNYDMQVELSISSILGITIAEAYKLLNEHPERKIMSRMNGCAMCFNDGTPIIHKYSDARIYGDTLHAFGKHCIRILTGDLAELTPWTTRLSFAWDNTDEIQENRKYANQLLNQADTIVIVGYSFHNYNNSIDKGLFKINGPKKITFIDSQDYTEAIEKLLYQDKPDGYLEKVRNKSMLEHSIRMNKSLNRFWVPDNLMRT
jgi:hypothetical protein